jgi:hypothetical protein
MCARSSAARSAGKSSWSPGSASSKILLFFAIVASPDRYETHCIAMTDMHRRPELSIDHPDHLVTILAVLCAERRDQKIIGVLEDARAKGEPRLASSFSGSNSNRMREDM